MNIDIIKPNLEINNITRKNFYNRPLYVVFICLEGNWFLSDGSLSSIDSNIEKFPFHFYITNDGNIYQGRDVNDCAAICYKNSPDSEIEYTEFNDSYSGIPTKISNKLYIAFQARTFVDKYNNTEILYDCTDSQYTSIIKLCQYLMDECSTLTRFITISQLDKNFINNPAPTFKLNEINSRIKNITLPITSTNIYKGNVYSYGSRTLKYNKYKFMSGNDVTVLQYYLRVIGIRKEEENGQYDKVTEDNVKTFQRKYKMEETGIVDDLVYEKLSSLNITRKRSYSEDLASTYKRLLEYNEDFVLYGGDCLTLNNTLHKLDLIPNSENKLLNNNYFTIDTEEAVKAYEKKFGYEIDGKVGPLLWTKILNTTVEYWGLSDDFVIIYGDKVNKTDENIKNVIGIIQDRFKVLAKKFSLIHTNVDEKGIYGNNTAKNVIKVKEALGWSLSTNIDKTFYDKIKNLSA